MPQLETKKQPCLKKQKKDREAQKGGYIFALILKVEKRAFRHKPASISASEKDRISLRGRVRSSKEWGADPGDGTRLD